MRKEFAEFIFNNGDKPYSDIEKKLLKRLSTFQEVNFFTISSPKFIRELIAEKVRVNIYEFRGSFADIAEKEFPEAKVFFNESLEFPSTALPVVCLDFLNYSENPEDTINLIKSIFPQSEIILGFDKDQFTGVNIDQNRYIFMGANGNINYRRFNDNAISEIKRLIGKETDELESSEEYIILTNKSKTLGIVSDVKEEIPNANNLENPEVSTIKNEESFSKKVKNVIKTKNKGV